MFRFSFRIVFLATLLFSGSLYSAYIGITPTRVEISVNKPIVTLTLSNQSDHTIVVQAQSKNWNRKDKPSVYTDSNDLIITPPIMVIKANSSQLIRVGLRKLPHLTEERTYRLLLTEQAPKRQQGTDGNRVVIVFKLNLPVFVAPVKNANNKEIE